jgi:signal transduction histidine kinase
MSEAPPQGWKLQHRLTAAFVLTGIVLGLVVAAATLLAIQVDRSQKRVVDRIFEAYALSNDLLASAIDSETAVRAYVVTGEKDFLAPFEQGRPEDRIKFARVQQLLQGQPEVLAALDDAAMVAGQWQQGWAEPTVALVASDGPGAVPRSRLREGDRLFNDVRVRYETYRKSLLHARDVSRERLGTATDRLFLLVVIGVVLVVVAAALLWVALRRWVTVPLDALGAEVRAVQGGAYDHRITVEGPPDIVEVAANVDAMRRAVVASYGAAVSANEEVDAQRRLLEVQAEELRRSNTELEQFAYVASHDLQEPLRKVASFCQMLERRYKGQLDERADQYIAFAVDGAKRMQQLINDLLAFSRVGRVTSDFTDVDLDICLAQVLRALDEPIDELGAEVLADPMPTVEGEASLLTQIFQNLIGNALKFRGTQPPRVRISVRREGDDWRFRCADNGIGVDEQYAERIFVIFQRLHAKDEYAGTGIGLALCKKIIEYHGGHIWLETSPQNDVPQPQGAVFCWTLPVAGTRTANQMNPTSSTAALDATPNQEQGANA